MDNLFITLFLLSIVGLVVGLVKPRWIFLWESERLAKFGHRKAVGVLFGTLIVLFFVLFGVTTSRQETSNALTPTLTLEQMERAEELLRQKKVAQKTTTPQKPALPKVEITEVGCQRLLDELIAVAEEKPTTKTALAQTFMMRKAVDAGLSVKNVPPDLPQFIVPDSLCGKTLDAYADVIIEGAKMPSYIIR